MKLLDKLPLPRILFLLELVLCIVIVFNVAYTEIDWRAYMDEVRGVLVDGELDYMKLRGDTGPLVYPAGFVWFYGALWWATGGGDDVFLAQLLFVLLYLTTLGVVLRLYARVDGVPRLALLLLVVSRRAHSVYMLRLFNDALAMTMAYGSFSLMLADRWLAACALYSAALSVKMNLLLFAPALLLLLMARFRCKARDVARHLGACALVQVALGAPFLVAHPVSYALRAFDFSRAFLYRWTVNWRFIAPETFSSAAFSRALLAAHVLLLLAFAQRQWLPRLRRDCNDDDENDDETEQLRGARRRRHSRNLSPTNIFYCLFTCNFIGIVCARSLHYQFYVWYFHALPLLLWHATALRSNALRVVLFVAIEYAWTCFPATPLSSGLLFAAHLTLLLALLLSDNTPRIKQE